MGMKKYLIGEVVALDPNCFSDDRKVLTKKIAAIESINSKSNIAVVSFGDGCRDIIGIDRLIMLRPHNDIVMKLIRNPDIPTEDLQEIIKLCNLYRHGDAGKAMEMALKNDNIRKICTINCMDWVNSHKQRHKTNQKNRKPKL